MAGRAGADRHRCRQPYMEIAALAHLYLCASERGGAARSEDAKNYYYFMRVSGFATGDAASRPVTWRGLATLVNTPNPMKFLELGICGRPENRRKPFLIPGGGPSCPPMQMAAPALP